MNKLPLKTVIFSVAVFALILGLGIPSGAKADAPEAKKLLKAMSDYMAGQKAISFAFDATLEVVTKDRQKLAEKSSPAEKSGDE